MTEVDEKEFLLTCDGGFRTPRFMDEHLDLGQGFRSWLSGRVRPRRCNGVGRWSLDKNEGVQFICMPEKIVINYLGKLLINLS